MKIQMFLISQQLKTHSQFLIITREIEWGLEKKNKDKMQKKMVTRPSQLMQSEEPIRPIGASLTLRPPQPPTQQITCEYCQNLLESKWTMLSMWVRKSSVA